MNPTPQFTQLHRPDAEVLLAEARAGLQARPARIAPKFFYDTQGARLFEAITALDEYPTTRAEAALMACHAEEIAAAVLRAVGTGAALVEPGAGNGEKAARLLAACRFESYVAIDIAADFLRESLGALQAQHPLVRMHGVGLDFSHGLTLPAGLVSGRALVFYPGSSIGNFDHVQALSLLRQMHRLAAGGALLIGVDLDKSAARLHAAYDDALGVTAAFNLNALRHLNRVIGSDFVLADWQHVALVNSAQARVEMHLQARHALTVRWPGGERGFAAGERIHTENAHKWERGAFEALLHDAGFAHVRGWADSDNAFALLLAH